LTRLTTAIRLAAAATLAATLIVLVPAPAGAGTPIKTGKYSGSTDQEAVASGFRKVEFTFKKGKVTLTTEPTVAFGACLSTPVFTLDGATPSKKIGNHRAFTITHTFFGNKIDKIHGRWTSSNEVDGYALYHFAAQDLCGQGKAKVNFTATKGGVKPKKKK
jgi:hypothetical protein